MPIFRPERTSLVRFGRVEAQIASRESVFMVAVGIKYAVVGETGRRGETRTRNRKAGQILSLLCIPIPPRADYLICSQLRFYSIVHNLTTMATDKRLGV